MNLYVDSNKCKKIQGDTPAWIIQQRIGYSLHVLEILSVHWSENYAIKGMNCSVFCNEWLSLPHSSVISLVYCFRRYFFIRVKVWTKKHREKTCVELQFQIQWAACKHIAPSLFRKGIPRFPIFFTSAAHKKLMSDKLHVHVSRGHSDANTCMYILVVYIFMSLMHF